MPFSNFKWLSHCLPVVSFGPAFSTLYWVTLQVVHHRDLLSTMSLHVYHCVQVMSLHCSTVWHCRQSGILEPVTVVVLKTWSPWKPSCLQLITAWNPLFDLYFYKCVLAHITCVLAFKQTSLINDFSNMHMPSHKIEAVLNDNRVSQNCHFHSKFLQVYMHLYMKYFGISQPKWVNNFLLFEYESIW